MTLLAVVISGTCAQVLRSEALVRVRFWENVKQLLIMLVRTA